MKSFLNESFVEKLIILQNLCEKTSYLHYRPCPNAILNIVRAFFEVIKFAFMTVYEFLIYGEHGLYDKFQVCFLQVQVL